MPRSQRNDNFIDKTFTVIADILLKVLPTSQREKQAFTYYRDGMSAQSEGEYAEALQNYYEALRLETDAYDRSYILYNIGLIHTSNGDHARALDYYYQALREGTGWDDDHRTLLIAASWHKPRPLYIVDEVGTDAGDTSLVDVEKRQLRTICARWMQPFFSLVPDDRPRNAEAQHSSVG
mgnify:CR=1 FL=1